MIQVTKVIIKDYFSTRVPMYFCEKFLMGAKCSEEGELFLELKVNRELFQEGPKLVPPIRWLTEFDKYDEFQIICKCEDSDETIEGMTEDDLDKYCHLSLKDSPIFSTFKEADDMSE